MLQQRHRSWPTLAGDPRELLQEAGVLSSGTAWCVVRVSSPQQHMKPLAATDVCLTCLVVDPQVEGVPTAPTALFAMWSWGPLFLLAVRLPAGSAEQLGC